MTRPLATLQIVGAVEVSSTGLPSTVAVTASLAPATIMVGAARVVTAAARAVKAA